MPKALRKSRWEAWENVCIQTAFTQKIQQKTIATALRRSVWAVSKKTKALGLKSLSPLQEQAKEEKPALPRREKMPRDQAKMIEILKTYAPSKCFQEGQLALSKGRWTQAQPIPYDNPHREECLYSMDSYDFLHSFVKPLEFIPSNESISRENRAKTIPGDPAYVSLAYVDQWAVSEGFHKIKGVLQQRGFSYWKDGIYFSQTQLLMHVNRLRLERRLQPIALIEEEGASLI